MKERVSKSIWIEKDAYMYLDRESRKQRGCKKMSAEAEERLWNRVCRHGELDKVQATDNSFGGGDGTYDGRWWLWSVDTLMKMLDEAGLPYDEGKEVKYISLSI